MVKWKARKENLNIGVMELSNLTFNEDYMEVSIDILSVSDDLQEEIYKAIETAKVEYMEDMKEYFEENPTRRKVWSDKPVLIQFNYLRIVLEAGKPISYSIVTVFEDAENEFLETEASTVVDLSEYENEIKKAVINVLVEKFF